MGALIGYTHDRDRLRRALRAFYQEHRRCGDLDTGLEGDRVWMTCTCGAVINQNADRD